MSPTVAVVVEGQSECESLGVLLRRLLAERDIWDVQIAKPFRVKRQKVVKAGELEKAVQVAVASRAAACVMVVLDADDDCPATLGPDLLARIRSVTPGPASVVLPKKELEAWFIGSVRSLAGECGLPGNADFAGDPEAVRDAKGSLSRLMPDRNYLEVEDQPRMMARFDLAEAQASCPSFDKLVRDFTGILADLGY